MGNVIGYTIQSFMTLLLGLLILWSQRQSRKDAHVQSEIAKGDTYFKQAVELSTIYQQEIGRLRQLVENLEEKLKAQEEDCERKISLLQSQLAGVISQLPPRSKQRFDESMQRNGSDTSAVA